MKQEQMVTLPDRLKMSLFEREASPRRIVFRNRRGFSVSIATLVSVVMGLVFVWLAVAPSASDLPGFLKWFVAGMAGLAVLSLAFYSLTRESLELDHENRVVAYRYRSPLEQHQWKKKFDDVKAVRMSPVANINRRAVCWQFSLIIDDGIKIPFQHASIFPLSLDQAHDARRFAKRIANYIGVDLHDEGCIPS